MGVRHGGVGGINENTEKKIHSSANGAKLRATAIAKKAVWMVMKPQIMQSILEHAAVLDHIPATFHAFISCERRLGIRL